MDNETISKKNLIKEALNKLKKLKQYQKQILDSIDGDTLNKPLSDYYLFLEVFETNLHDCITLYKEKDLTLEGELEMKWIIVILNVL